MNSQVDRVQSPCIGSCCLDEQDICLGCFRDLEEIKAWSSADNSTRQSIIDNASRRERIKRD